MSATLILYAVMLIIVLLAVRGEKIPWPERLGFRKVNPLKETPIAIGFALLLVAVAIVLGMVFYAINPSDATRTSDVLNQISASDLIITIVAAAFVEEIFFRGYLQRKTNLWVATFLFALMHIAYGSISQIVGAFALGLILGIEYKMRKALYAPILSHFLYDAAVLLMMFTVG